MSKYLNSLFALLALQLTVAGWLYFKDAQQGEFVTTPILAVDSQRITEVEISEGDKQLVLSKQEGEWHLSDYPQLALNASNVDSVINQLSALKAVWPVADSKASHTRFNVADDNFAKQVTYTLSDGTKHTLLLGKSPSFKKLYVRNSEQDNVYSVEFSAYQVSADENTWLDKSLLAVSDITRIEHNTLVLEKQEEKWQLATTITPQNREQEIDSQKVQNVANTISGLRVIAISQAQLEQSEQLSVLGNNDKQYQFAFAEQNDKHFVKRGDMPYWFEVSKASYDTLANVQLDTLTSGAEKGEVQSPSLSE
ncbi:DUF4340 domain-containing protein [Pseudoalteromonas sp. JBTF-M23]|uniref:DUF4340 domain-containing protein n=1 Tax=Pseudoalteromonas caenipelagi TaxID=2726988 RepID=A0A849VIH0_9GAMM|nr:DUF4340 domain-containing protein [Pseudoalteromonas caenipelagi]NOU51457.1 DUF4340 domain-containing protein [Pseudoalteromonas caenipelagi]